MHHLGDGQTHRVGKGNAPRVLELLARGQAGHVLVAGVGVGQSPHVARALNVVLTSKRVDATTGYAHVPQQHLEVGAGGHIGHPHRVLGYAQRVEKRPRPVLGHHACGLLQLPRRNTGDLTDHFRRVLGHDDLQVLEPLRALGDEGTVLPAFADDNVHQPIEQCEIGARSVTQVQIRARGYVRTPRVRHDELCAAHPLGPPHLDADHRVLLGGIAADDEDAAAVSPLCRGWSWSSRRCRNWSPDR